MRRTGLALGIVAGAVAVAVAAVVLVSASGRAPAEPWHQSVRQLPVLPGSQGFGAAIVDQYHRAYGGVGVSDGIPIVHATGTPMPLEVNPGCQDFRRDTGPIAIPAAATPLLASSDSPLVVVDTATDTDWELWQAHHLPDGRWSACWGGRLDHESQSAGVFPYPYGLAGSGIAYLSTTITEADVASGHIDHTVAVDITSCSAPEAAPADRTDCSGPKGQPSEGTVLRFPSDLAPPPGLTPFGLLVFRAIQSYGMVVVDQAGAVMIQAEKPMDWAINGHGGVDPITTSWAGRPEWEQVNTLPWADLEAVSSPQVGPPRGA